MKVHISAKQLDVAEAVRRHVARQLTLGVEKYFGNPIEATVAFSREAHLYRADCSVHVGQGITVQSHAEGADLSASFDAACERLQKRLRRYKRRLRDYRDRRTLRTGAGAEELLPARSYVLAAESEKDEGPETFEPVIVAETKTNIDTLSVGEAVMRMDLAELPAVLFRNGGNGRLNVVYRRPDGHIGWIDPTGPEAAN